MGTSEIIAIVAVATSILSLLASVVFNSRKDNREVDKDRIAFTQAQTETIDKLNNIAVSLSKLDVKMESLENKIERDHETLIQHDQKIKHLEKEVFRHN
jgi:peptidoglycan hydrolase CwlO-like protein